jgi:hypothetical protein
MVDCKSVSAPMDMQDKVSVESRPPVADPTTFKSLTRALQFLTFTHPDIAYVVQQICPTCMIHGSPPLTAMKRTMCYIRGTLHYGLLL